VTMHPSGTVTEIWRVKDNGVTSFLHRYGDMALQILDAQTGTQKERWKNGKRKRKGEGKRKEKWKRKKKGKGEGE